MAVEIAPRAMRDLSELSCHRPGLVPVLGDARQPQTIAPYIRSQADWMHQDLSIADQAKTFVRMAGAFLRPGGTGLLSLKAASERSSDGDDDSRFAKAAKILRESDFEVIERINLKGLEEQHVVFLVRKTAHSG